MLLVLSLAALIIAHAAAPAIAPADSRVAAAGLQAPERQVRWWMGFGSPENNLRLIDSHPKAVTGIYTYIGAGVESSGSFDCPHNESFLRQQFEPYWARGLSVTPALALTNASVMTGSALKHVAEVAAFAKKINVSGFMLDFEPKTSEVAWVHAVSIVPLIYPARYPYFTPNFTLSTQAICRCLLFLGLFLTDCLIPVRRLRCCVHQGHARRWSAG